VTVDDTTEPAMDSTTLERALLYGVLQGGVDAYFKACEIGITAEFTEDKVTKEKKYRFFEEAEDAGVFAFFKLFLRREKRLPLPPEIKAGTGVALVVPEQPYSVTVFAERLVKCALRNAISERLGRLAELLVTDPEKARKAMAQLVRDTAWSLGRITSYTDPGTAKELLADYERAKASTGELMGLSSPWLEVDRYSLGLQPGELTVLLAKRKVGKTWLLLAWFMHILRNDLKAGECLLLVSMEMPKKQIYRRMAAIDMKLNYEDFRSGRLTVDEEARLSAWAEEMQTPDPDRPTIHVATAAEVRDVADICDKVAELNPRAVGVDGMYILGRDRRMGMWERTIQNCSEIKLDLCAEMDIAVLATTQLKGTKDKYSLEADADDAAYAKAIGDWADAMRGLFMSKNFERDGMRMFTFMESREFRGIDFEIFFKLTTMNFGFSRVADKPAEEGEGEGEKKEDEEGGDAKPLIDGTGDAAPEVSIEGAAAEVPEEAPEADESDDDDDDDAGEDTGEVGVVTF